jgi:ribosomal protein S12 methylthiotransferase accessory factor
MSASLSVTPPAPVDARTGLIRWVFDLPIQPGEPAIFNCAVKMADTIRYLSRPCYDNNGGSGLTRESARAAAIGEGIERYCSSYYVPEQFMYGTLRELRQAHNVYPSGKYALFYPGQKTDYQPFLEDTKLAWVWGYDLLARQPTLIPACMVYLPYEPAFLDQGEQCIAPALSTGLACARSREEALLKGIFESVERDAFMITWLNRLPVSRVDIDSCKPLRELYKNRLQRDGLVYVLVEITTDIPIPTFLCLLIDERRSPSMICAGAAAHFDPVRAASKAMLEAVQTREWAKFLAKDGQAGFAPNFSDIRQFDDHVRLFAYGDMMRSVQFILDTDRFSGRDWQDQGTGHPASDLDKALDLCAQHDVDVIAIDLTAPDVEQAGYYVTRAFAPSLQPLYADFNQRFLGGARLYQVPRILGFTKSDTTLDSLNPYPHPFP